MNAPCSMPARRTGTPKLKQADGTSHPAGSLNVRAPCQPEPRKRSHSAVVWCSWQKLGLLHAGNLRVPQLELLGPDPKRVLQRPAHWEPAIHSSASLIRRKPLASLECGRQLLRPSCYILSGPHPCRVH